MSERHEERGPTRWRAGLAIASGLVALGLGFVWTDGAAATRAVRNYGYMILCGTALGFVWALVRCLGEDDVLGRGFAPVGLRERAWAAWTDWRAGPWKCFSRSIGAMVIGGTLVCAVAEPTGFKILFDEYVLQATAQNMHLSREVGTIVRAHEVEGVWLPLGAYVDKRPYFFAFVLSVLHDLSGFRVANAFVLNHVLTALLLALVGLTVRRLTRRAEAGVLAGWLLAALPLLGQNTNGSGMEVLNAVMIAGVFLLGLRYLERPGGARQDAFLLGAVLLAQCRYESALYVAAAGFIVLLGWWRAGSATLSLVTMLVPLALLPVAWVRQVFAANEVLWQLPEHLSKPFGAEHVTDNLAQAGRYFFSLDVNYSNLAPLALAGLVALVGLGGLLLVRKVPGDPGAASQASLVWFATVLSNFVLLMHYYWGQLTDPLVSRLSLPLWIVFATAVAVVLARVEDKGRRVLARALGVAMVLGLALHGRAAARHVYTQENILEQEIRWELDWVASRPVRPRIVITNKSTLPWLLERVPAVLAASARSRADAIAFHLRQQGGAEILVTQRLRPTSAGGGFTLDPEDALPPGIRMERLAERRFGYNIATIQRVVAVEAPAPADISP